MLYALDRVAATCIRAQIAHRAVQQVVRSSSNRAAVTKGFDEQRLQEGSTSTIGRRENCDAVQGTRTPSSASTGWLRTVKIPGIIPGIRKVAKNMMQRSDAAWTKLFPTYISHGEANIVKQGLELRSSWLFREHTLTKTGNNVRLENVKSLDLIRKGRLSDVVWTDKIFTAAVAHDSENHRQQLLSPTWKKSRTRRIRSRTLFLKSMVVWAGMTSEGKTLFVFVDKNARINSDVYQNVILDGNLILLAKNIFREKGLFFSRTVR